MAILRADELNFDFQYVNFSSSGWVEYRFFFKWKDENIVNNSVLKQRAEYPEGAFFANEGDADSLLPLIKKVLEEDKADYWEAMDPDIVVAIYPGSSFPFLPFSREVEDEKEKSEKKTDDLFNFIVFVDAYNFKDADAYHGQGIALHMLVTRSELEEFCQNLEAEYQEFKQKFEVDKWLEKNG